MIHVDAENTHILTLGTAGKIRTVALLYAMSKQILHNHSSYQPTGLIKGGVCVPHPEAIIRTTRGLLSA
jgi:hypothetical protein